MKTRQFKKLAGAPRSQQVDLVLEGLTAIGANVSALSDELEKCNKARAFRSARLVCNAGREEAGKFLILIDAWRAPGAEQRAMSKQFARAGDHLSKLIYARIAEYAIASQAELLRAVESHRKSRYLDGPNDYDWIFRNDLLSERENALYVDLVDAEGKLEWWMTSDDEMSTPVPSSMRLVGELLASQLVSPAGLRALQEAWRGFDAHEDSHCQDWQDRTARALSTFPDTNVQGGRLNAGASFIARRWPMPMVELRVEQDIVSVEALVAEREAAHMAWVRREFGDDW